MNKFTELRIYVEYEQMNLLNLVKLPEVTPEEREFVINECRKCITDLGGLKLGDLSIYKDRIKVYQRIIELLK